MYCPPEPWLLLPLATARSERMLAMAAFDYRLAMRGVHEFLTPERFDSALGAFAVTAYNSVLADSHKRVLVDKTPRYYQILSAIDALFPQALQIWIKRNPLDTIASCIGTWSIPLDELLGETISPYTFDVTISFNLLANHFANKHDKKMVVTYEDFTTKPTAYVEEICRRCGLRYEPGMLEYAANQPLMRAYRDASMGDKKILDASGLHSQSIDRWRKDLSPVDVARIVRTLGRDVFDALDYAALYEDACAYAGVDRVSVSEAGRMNELLRAYNDYGMALGANEGTNGVSPRADVQYTLLGQRTDELEQAAEERLGLIQHLDRQLSQPGSAGADRYSYSEAGKR